MKKVVNKHKWYRVVLNDGSSSYTYLKKAVNPKGGVTHKVIDVYNSGFIYRCVQDLSKAFCDEGYYRFYRIDVRLR